MTDTDSIYCFLLFFFSSSFSPLPASEPANQPVEPAGEREKERVSLCALFRWPWPSPCLTHFVARLAMSSSLCIARGSFAVAQLASRSRVRVLKSVAPQRKQVSSMGSGGSSSKELVDELVQKHPVMVFSKSYWYEWHSSYAYCIYGAEGVVPVRWADERIAESLALTLVVVVVVCVLVFVSSDAAPFAPRPRRL